MGYPCPKCGSLRFKRINPDQEFALVNDRICGDCGTKFTPPVPHWMPIALGLMGCLVLGAGVYFLWRFVAKDDAVSLTPAGLTLFFGSGIAGIVTGVVLWRRRSRPDS